MEIPPLCIPVDHDSHEALAVCFVSLTYFSHSNVDRLTKYSNMVSPSSTSGITWLESNARIHWSSFILRVKGESSDVTDARRRGLKYAFRLPKNIQRVPKGTTIHCCL